MLETFSIVSVKCTLKQVTTRELNIEETSLKRLHYSLNVANKNKIY